MLAPNLSPVVSGTSRGSISGESVSTSLVVLAGFPWLSFFAVPNSLKKDLVCFPDDRPCSVGDCYHSSEKPGIMCLTEVSGMMSLRDEFGGGGNCKIRDLSDM